jgi:HEPN domain-containing protein
MKKNDLVEEWMEYAQRDLLSAKFLTSMNPEPLEIICFHCQQAAEKALKAILVFMGIRIPKTHDLDLLLELCGSNENIRNLRIVTIPLNDYSVITRYPFFQMIDIEDKEQAIHAAEIVLETVRSELS